MPLIEVTLRTVLEVSPQRNLLLAAGDEGEYAALQEELRDKLRTPKLEIDSVDAAKV